MSFASATSTATFPAFARASKSCLRASTAALEFNRQGSHGNKTRKKQKLTKKISHVFLSRSWRASQIFNCFSSSCFNANGSMETSSLGLVIVRRSGENDSSRFPVEGCNCKARISSITSASLARYSSIVVLRASMVRRTSRILRSRSSFERCLYASTYSQEAAINDSTSVNHHYMMNSPGDYLLLAGFRYLILPLELGGFRQRDILDYRLSYLKSNGLVKRLDVRFRSCHSCKIVIKGRIDVRIANSGRGGTPTEACRQN